MTSLPRVNRRQFLALSAYAGVAGVLSSCGSSSGGTAGTIEADGALQVVKRFPNSGLVPGKVRLPISLGDSSGVLTSDGSVTLPGTLTARIVRTETGEVVSDSLTAARRGENLSIPYWPFVFDVTQVGVYSMTIEEAPDAEMTFMIEERAGVPMPLVGDPLPPFDTPTTDDPRGIDPICTRQEGACPFHSQTLTSALKSGKPVVYLIGTPAYCKTGTCAPGLDALIEVSRSLGDAVAVVHADVYTDKTATVAAPAVQAYKLSYEPILYITDLKGVLVDRLDAVFDVAEMRDAISAAGIS